MRTRVLTAAVVAGALATLGAPVVTADAAPAAVRHAPAALAAAHPATRPAAHPAALRTLPKSLVYVKSGDIYLAHQNGTHRVVVKRGTFYWPSMDDNGVIAAEGADGQTAPDGSAGYSIYRFNQHGKRLSRARTPADFSTLSCPTYPPNHITLSPGGKRLAYDFWDCDQTISVWTPATRLAFPGQGAGQEGYNAPVWLGTSRILLSHIGVRVAGGKEMGVYRVGDGGDSVRDWFDAQPWATGFMATATRNGKKIAILEDDAANYFDGEPRHVKLVLLTSTGVLDKPRLRCALSLPVSRFSGTWYGVSNASLSFNSAGSILVFDARNGLWRAHTGRLGTCSTVKPALWIKGAFDGFFSPAVDRR